jgi:L-2-hydroxycarboxylate dehydrogenase (NAD+)
MQLNAQKIRAVAETILMNFGAPPLHAQLQTDLLLEAQMRGFASHGLLRLRRITERIQHGVVDPAATGRHEWLAPSYLGVDGMRGLGPVVALNALNAVEPVARSQGIAIACIRNNNHIGMLAWFAEKIAASGLILIAATTSEALVHPWGGRKAMVGTNPLVIAVPAEPAPLILDMATSHVSMGKIHDYANRGEEIPDGWAIDADGNPTTDAAAAKTGAIAPFGGAKGYALGLALEVLVTSLSAGAIGNDVKGTLDSESICNKGDIFIVISPKQGHAVSGIVNAYLQQIRNCEPAIAGQPVSIPGDRARAQKADSLASGVRIDEGLWRDLVELEKIDNPKTKARKI